MSFIHEENIVTLAQAKYQIEKLRREVDQWYGPKNDAYKMKQIDLATAEKLLWQAEQMEKKSA
tara:strand:+ start:6521 stop:6709 length:189 start_codon:yes stop_codon:yes gene_type:complete